jgi:hypothetical protein
MKNILVLCLLCLSSLNIVRAQFPVTISYNDEDVTNSTLTLLKDASMNFAVSNTGVVDLTIVTEITEITTPHKAPGWEVCWGSCVLPNSPMVVGSVIVPAGTTNTSDFHLIYHSEGNSDPANITFHLYADGNPNNFVTLILDSEFVGVDTLQSDKMMSIFPNPATDVFTIHVYDNSNSELVFTNILGKTLKKIAFPGAQLQFNTNQFPKGIYFVSLVKNQKILTTHKLIMY